MPGTRKAFMLVQLKWLYRYIATWWWRQLLARDKFRLFTTLGSSEGFVFVVWLCYEKRLDRKQNYKAEFIALPKFLVTHQKEKKDFTAIFSENLFYCWANMSLYHKIFSHGIQNVPSMQFVEDKENRKEAKEINQFCSMSFLWKINFQEDFSISILWARFELLIFSYYWKYLFKLR